MKIEKNGAVYEVNESANAWTLTTKVGSVPVKYTVQKTDCPTLDELKAFVAESSAL